MLTDCLKVIEVIEDNGLVATLVCNTCFEIVCFGSDFFNLKPLDLTYPINRSDVFLSFESICFS